MIFELKTKVKNSDSIYLTKSFFIIFLSLFLTLQLFSCTSGSSDETQKPSIAVTDDINITVMSDSPPETSAPKPPKIIFTTDKNRTAARYDGYSFSILEHLDGIDSFGFDGNGVITLAESYSLQLEDKTGAKLKTLMSNAPINDVEKSLMSGYRVHDALFLSVKELSSLLRSGYLDDLSMLGLDPNTEGIDITPSESLAIKGGYYMAVGSISPKSINGVFTLFCDLKTALSNEIYAIFGNDVRDASLMGEMTLEKMMSALKNTELITSSTGVNSALCISNTHDKLPYLALLSAMNGEIISVSQNELSIAIETDNFERSYSAALMLSKDASDDHNAVFSIQKFSSDKASNTEYCHLPLPKPTLEATYRCLCDPNCVMAVSVPMGDGFGARTSDILSALFEISIVKNDSFLKQITYDNNSYLLAHLINSSRCFDLAILYNWGDLASCCAEGISNGTKHDNLLGDDYTARKKAAETALDIFIKRISVHTN